MPAPVLLCLLLALPAPADDAGSYTGTGQLPPDTKNRVVALLNEGVALMRDNHNQEAVERFSQAAALDPGDWATHLDLGLALAKTGRTDEAIGEIKRCLALNPDSDSALVTLGGLYQSSGRVDQALEVYREFLSRFPRHSESARVASLVKGLEAASPSLDKQAAAGAACASSGGAGDDYLAAVTANGTLRWAGDRMPLKVYIAPGEGVPGFRPEMPSLLRQAFDDWGTAAGGRLRFSFVGSPQEADIKCTWLADPSALSNSAEAGETRVFTSGMNIVSGTIKLLTVPLTDQLPLTDNRLRQICLHEIGHVLGLAGHTTDPADAMCFSSSVADRWRRLTARDSNTIRRLYSTGLSAGQARQP